MPGKPEMQEMGAAASQLKQCPIGFTSRIIGKKFTLLIMRNMLNYNHSRFNEFLTIEGINPKTLSLRLKEMQKDGIIGRRVYHETPIRIEYFITEKGRALRPVLDQMMAFSMQNYPKEIFKDGRPRSLQEFVGKV